MTMDILWAISHPASGAPMSSQSFPSNFSVQTPPYADGTKETYEDFVGGVQFWGYGLVSGSGDGAVRMWDSRSNITIRGEHKLIFKIPSAYWASSQDAARAYWPCNVSPV